VYEGHTLSVSHTYETPALGHDWGEWVIDGDNHYRLCQRDGCEARDEAAHNYGNWTYVDEISCKGVCECGAEITDAHSGGTATCVKGPICEKCGSEYGNPDTENGHSWDTRLTWDDKEHWYPCIYEGCEAKLKAEAHTAHEPEIVPGKPATCTEEGTTDETFCSVCGAPISEQEIIEPLGHQLTAVAKVEATCTAPGTEAYWKCTRDGCGKLFSDADGKNETSLEALTIPALGHDWATELTKGETTHYYACSRCDERKDEAAHTGGTATCKAKAKCSVCGGEYGELAEHQYHPNVWYHDENDHWHRCNVCGQDSPHEAHSGGTPTCTEPARCDACGNPYGEPLGHEIVFVDYVRPTCTEDGMLEHYECTRCGKVFDDAAGTREPDEHYMEMMVMPASGHTEVVDAAVAPTCTEDGLTEGKHCARCEEVLEAQKVVPALGHELVHHDGKAATCTEAGTEAYWQCTRCDKLFSDAEGKNEITAPTAIEALGHLPSPVEKVEPTCTTPGTKAYWKCTRCDKLFSGFSDVACDNEITAPAAIEALGHDYHVVGRANDIEIYECRRCPARYMKIIGDTTSPTLDLVQDETGQAMPYRMEAVDTPAGKAVVVTPDVDQSGQRANQDAQQIASLPTLCLTKEVVKKWLEEGFKFTWFVNGEATLEIDLGKLDFERLFPDRGYMGTHQKAVFLISMWSESRGLDVLVRALKDTASVPVTGLAGLTLRIGDTTVDVTLDAEGKFTYTLVS